MEKNDQLPYSYHTFILPLVWGGGDGDKPFDELCSDFGSGARWTCCDPTDRGAFPAEEDPMDYYSEYKYFYPQARSALYGSTDDENAAVRTYAFDPGLIRNKARYIIEKGGTAYMLTLNAIRVKFYSSGIMLFILECENHDHRSFAAVKAINEFGRRISLPFINPVFSLCADRLSIVTERETFTTDFRSLIENIANLEPEEQQKEVNLDSMANFIADLLNCGSQIRFATSPVAAENELYIRPALDERMFIACEVSDQETVSSFTELRENGKLAFETDDRLANSLYEFIFVDTEGGCSCKNREMRGRLLKEHVYERWLEGGSIYASAAQSLALLTNGKEPHIVTAFLTEYVKMCCLCLAQRASLMHFQHRIAEIARKPIKLRTAKLIISLRNEFSEFESRLCLNEVSSQEQAIELYDKVRRSFNIKNELKNVKSQLDGLGQTAEAYFDMSFNKIGYIFAILGLICSLSEVFGGKLMEGSFPPGLLFAIMLIISAAAFIIIGSRYKIKKK